MKSERVILSLLFMLTIYLFIEMAILILTPKEEIPSETLASTYTLGGEVEEEPKRKESSVIIAQKVEEIEKIDYEIFEVTAYTAGFESTGKYPGDPLYGVTASGVYVEENFTIACPPSMEFGTRIYIPYFDNEFECQDRGGSITEDKLDVYIPVLEDALEFGRRDLKVIIRMEIPSKGG
jgi:3D (Asp-Asp-Asp) domain-containing protein